MKDRIRPRELDQTQKEKSILLSLDNLVLASCTNHALLESSLSTTIVGSTSERPWQVERITDSLSNFLSLRKPQIDSLINSSYKYGIPLSPVGIMTFTTGEFNEMIGAIALGRARKTGTATLGSYLDGEEFIKGCLKDTGLWVTNSESVARFTAEEEIIQKGIDTNPTKKLITPTIVDVRAINASNEHEAFHSSRWILTKDRTIGNFETALLDESMAYRAQWISRGYSPSELKSKLTTYFQNPTKTQIDTINNIIDIVTTNVDNEYQGLITWLSILAKNTTEFIHPSPEMISLAQKLRNLSVEKYIPLMQSRLITK